MFFGFGNLFSTITTTTSNGLAPTSPSLNSSVDDSNPLSPPPFSFPPATANNTPDALSPSDAVNLNQPDPSQNSASSSIEGTSSSPTPSSSPTLNTPKKQGNIKLANAVKKIIRLNRIAKAMTSDVLAKAEQRGLGSSSSTNMSKSLAQTEEEAKTAPAEQSCVTPSATLAQTEEDAKTAAPSYYASFVSSACSGFSRLRSLGQTASSTLVTTTTSITRTTHAILGIGNTNTVKMLEKRLVLMGPALNQLSPGLYKKMIFNFACVKNPTFFTYQCARSFGLSGEAIDARLSKDPSEGITLGGLFDFVARWMDSVPGDIQSQIMGSYHQSEPRVKELSEASVNELSEDSLAESAGEAVKAAVMHFDQSYNAQWSMTNAMTQAKNKVVTKFASKASTPSLTQAQAKTLSVNILGSIRNGISKTLKNMSENGHEGAGAASMLHSLICSQTAGGQFMSGFFDDHLSDALVKILTGVNEKVNTEYMKFYVVNPLYTGLLDLGTQAGVKLAVKMMSQSQPELYNMVDGFLNMESVQNHLSTAKTAFSSMQREQFLGHIFAYACHWKNVTDASFNKILSASPETNPRLAHSITALCSIIGRGNAELTKNVETCLRNSMAMYELQNFVRTSDPVAFTEELQSAIESDGFLSEAQTKQSKELADSFKSFWTAPSDPRIAQLQNVVYDAINKARAVSIQVSNGPIAESLASGLKASTAVSRTNEAMGIGTTVAMQHGANIAVNAMGNSVVNLIFAGLKAAAHTAGSVAVHEAATVAKNKGIDSAVSALKPDSQVATLTAQTCVFLEQFATGAHAVLSPEPPPLQE